MPKKTNHLFKTVSVTLFVAALLSANGAIWGQITPQNVPIVELVGLADYNYLSSPQLIHVTYLRGVYQDPSLSNANFPASHVTRDKRRIGHWTECVLEKETYDNPYTVPQIGSVADAANRLHDTAYSAWGYTRVTPGTDIDTSMVCHGYSTGLGTWMPLQPKLADDYEKTYRHDHLAPGAIFARPYVPYVWIKVLDIPPNSSFGVSDHSSRIDSVDCIAGTHDLAVSVTEKNRVSALYRKSFTMQALCPNNDHFQCDGKCSMKNAPLPWSPDGFYRVKP